NKQPAGTTHRILHSLPQAQPRLRSIRPSVSCHKITDMRNTTIYFILLFLFSCNFQKSDYQKNIILFENHIGKENAKELTKLINEFEKYLEEKYPNEAIDSAYTFFLRNINSGYVSYHAVGINKIWDKRLMEIKDRSSFKNEIYLYTDSVWLENGEIKYSTCYYGADTVRNESGEFIIPNGDNEDSVRIYMDDIKKMKEFNLNGKYYTGLDLIKGQDSVIIGYLDAKFAAGCISSKLFSQGFLYSKPDFKNYFHKRIFIVELFY
ncbi:MAG: hypothetical protein JXC36_01085, partial [Candidatus Atribacteria bacterium]|nr:hypothetical protein [Candidatus Atribacteria bacterium]